MILIAGQGIDGAVDDPEGSAAWRAQSKDMHIDADVSDVSCVGHAVLPQESPVDVP